MCGEGRGKRRRQKIAPLGVACTSSSGWRHPLYRKTVARSASKASSHIAAHTPCSGRRGAHQGGTCASDPPHDPVCRPRTSHEHRTRGQGISKRNPSQNVAPAAAKYPWGGHDVGDPPSHSSPHHLRVPARQGRAAAKHYPWGDHDVEAPASAEHSLKAHHHPPGSPCQRVQRRRRPRSAF